MPKRSELKVTKRAVDALSVKAGDAVFWDRELAGFVTSKFAKPRTSEHWHHNLLIIQHY